ncbi:phosphoribosyl transferase [Streptomyces cinnamoneus]|uniref:Phosphoribosyl transferase n=1 Tax=Streptomyces cinnamoneus TaxID=53446 RepID=A0A2G1XNY2_STRCJ|nr:phosphoribosyltransferase family protein [Streptomyces cinnamoneus]PHQ52947.1 phosphoribosyl transferase [Streptomyces cinnamoneus]PPT11391.1 phosphoribosyl transferase [Streptomyces cinnamoneus]
MRFIDRVDAGRRLAERLEHLRDERPVVLGLPRGGVPVAFEIAHALRAPLDVILVRKLGVPYHRELGFGAIGEGGVRVVSDDIVRMSRIDEDDLAEVQRGEEAELARQAERFRAGRPRVPLRGRTAVVVDDGIATGATASAAVQVAGAQGAARVVLAVPVAPPDTAETFRAKVDELVCLSTPAVFSAVGEWYHDFSQTEDEEVMELLRRNAAETRDEDAGGGGPGRLATGPVRLPVEGGAVELAGDLTLPEGAPGLVVFAHGSGSSRLSPRNRAVARALNDAGLATLLFDLLTPEEETDRANVFAVEPLARRLTEVTRWLRRRAAGPVCYFGASTGAAAALWAAADAPGGPDAGGVAAVVSRGGRPDLAGPRLGDVTAPTLLVVGGLDDVVLDLNRRAAQQLRCENRLAVVPGATHLFEEPGTLDAVADLARDWFTGHLTPAASAP